MYRVNPELKKKLAEARARTEEALAEAEEARKKRVEALQRKKIEKALEEKVREGGVLMVRMGCELWRLRGSMSCEVCARVLMALGDTQFCSLSSSSMSITCTLAPTKQFQQERLARLNPEARRKAEEKLAKQVRLDEGVCATVWAGGCGRADAPAGWARRQGCGGARGFGARGVRGQVGACTSV